MTQAYEITRPCPKSFDGRHDIQYPRMEDSIDKQRDWSDAYCKLCFARQPMNFNRKGDASMDKLSLAIPNGTMEKQIIAMLALVGIVINRHGREFSVPVDHPLVGEVRFMRPMHMPALIAQGKCDLAICGRDWYLEACYGVAVPVSEVRCHKIVGPGAPVQSTRIILFCHQDDPARRWSDVLPFPKPLISEYPELTRDWLVRLAPTAWGYKRNGHTQHPSVESDITRVIHHSYGSTEAHVPRDYRFGVCLTESGATLRANNLKIIATLLATYPVLLTVPPTLVKGSEEKSLAIAQLVSDFRTAGLLRPKKERG